MDSLIVARSPAGHAARRCALQTLFHAMTGAALASALHGCGGGGAVPPPPPPAPVPTPAPSPTPSGPIAAQMTVPTPVGYDVERLAAFKRLNEIRLSAGLGMVAQSPAMDQAAQAHADWMVANDVFSHQEQAGTPGFTASDWPLRDEVFGYVPVGGGEVMAAPTHGAAGVDGLINTLYHRVVMLAFEPVDVGIGWSSAGAAHVSMPLVVDLTRPGTDVIRGWGQAAQAIIDGAAIWPLDGAQNVPLRLGAENPNPVPARDVFSLGTPVSITVHETASIAATTFMLKNASTGASVSTRLLDSTSDPNLLLARSSIAVVPLDALTPSTTYTVSFIGTITEVGASMPVALSRAWTFTTAPN
ncbi:MAG: hypothetical protein JF586_15575 [Burkholderiales bacterium]|nr:hypothetical protein [Burkholderiales bacterium]